MPLYDPNDPFASISSYMGEFGSPGDTGVYGPRGLSQEVRHAAGRFLGFGGPYGDDRHNRYLQSTGSLDPYMDTGDPTKMMPWGVSESQHQALARLHGYQGPFGTGQHNAWLDAVPGRRAGWLSMRDTAIENMGLRGETQRKIDYLTMLDSLAQQKRLQGGTFYPEPPPVTVDTIPPQYQNPQISSNLPVTNPIDLTRWTEPGPLPHTDDPRFGVPFGISRSALRNLGFGEDFGEGRGNAFVDFLGSPLVQQEIQRLRYPGGPHIVDEVTLAPMPVAPPPEDTAFQPNFPLFYNPALMNAMVGEGRLPQFGAPWFGEMDMGGRGGAGRYIDEDRLADLEEQLASLRNDPWSFLGVEQPLEEEDLGGWWGRQQGLWNE